MQIQCSNCNQGNMTPALRCNYCGASLDYKEWLEYECLNYLLREVNKPAWQNAFLPEVGLPLLLPYKAERLATGLNLGILSLLPEEGRSLEYAAALYLSNTLQNCDPELLKPELKFRLQQYLETGLTLLDVQYKHLGQLPPTLSSELRIEDEMALLKEGLHLLNRFNQRPIIEISQYYPLAALYSERLEALNAQAQARQQAEEALEAARQTQQVKQAVQEAEILQQAEMVEVVPPLPQVAIQEAKSRRFHFEFRWETIWNGLLSETTLRALLYLGALFVVIAATLYTTLNWKQFPPFTQATLLFGADLVAFAAGLFILLKLNLRRAGLTFIAIGLALLPLVVYGYSRPELMNLDNRGSWLWVSLLALPCYLLVTMFIRERLFSYMSCLAALNAFWAVLYQFGLAPEWLAVAGVGFAAGLIWIDGKLKNQAGTEELANAPFWVGQILVIVTAGTIFSYYLNLALTGQPNESIQWALGLTWLLATAFYVWCALRYPENKVPYYYGATLAGAVATYLILQKLPSSFLPVQGVVMGLLGLGYLALQNIPELVDHLNDDENTAAWKFREVLGGSKPLNITGWLLLVGSLGLNRDWQTVAVGLALPGIALALGALLYNWRWMSYAAVIVEASSYGLLVVLFLPLYTTGLALAIAATLFFGLWSLVRRSARGRVQYFRLPLEIAGHVSAALILALSPVMFLYYHTWDVVSLDWLILAAIYSGLAMVYKARWWVDGAIVLGSGALFALLPWNSLAIAVAGIVLVGVGFILGEKTPPLYSKIYGWPLRQWGYVLATVGLGLASFEKRDTFLLVGGLYVVLALSSAMAGHLGLVSSWSWLDSKEENGRNPGLVAFWLYPVMVLLPIWLWQALRLGLEDFSLVMGVVALLYFADLLGLWRLYGDKTNFTFLHPVAPGWAGWLLAGGLALLLAQNNPGYTLQVATIMGLTSAFAAYKFKNWGYNSLLVGLVFWTAGIILWWTNHPNFWNAPLLAVTAIALVVTGYVLQGNYNLPFRLGSHFMAGLAFLVTGLDYTLGKTDLPQVLTALVPMLLIAGLYLGLAIYRRQPGYFYAGTPATLALVALTGAALDFKTDWDISVNCAWGYLLLAGLATFFDPLIPRAETRPPKGLFFHFSKEDALLQLGHGFAVLALVIGNILLLFGHTQLGWLNLGVIGFYIWRGYYERRAELLGLVTMLGAVALINQIYSSHLPLYLAGLGLMVLAFSYLGLSQLFKILKQKVPVTNYNFGLAANIFSYTAQVLILPALVFALDDNTGLLWGLILATLLGGLLAWRERMEWSYVTASFALATYSWSFYLLKLPWEWFGLALFLPAVGLWLTSLQLPRFAPRCAATKQIFLWAAGVLTVIGLAFSWQQNEIMLTHTLLLTALGVILLRKTRRIEWLYPAEVVSLYSALLLLTLLNVKFTQAGLAVLAITLPYLAALVYFHYRATWLEPDARTTAKDTLAVLAQGVGLAGVGLNWYSTPFLALNLIGLTGIYLVIRLLIDRRFWSYPPILTGHLAYLATLSVLEAFFTGGNVLTFSQAGLALLPVGLGLTLLACWSGYKKGESLGQLLAQGHAYPPEVLQSRTFMLYLTGGLDLLISLALSATDATSGLIVTLVLVITVALFAVWEKVGAAAWATLGLLILGIGFYYSVSKIEITTLAAQLAGLAFVLNILFYFTYKQGRWHILSQPAFFAVHCGLGLAGLFWLVGLTQKEPAWNELSWIVALVGLNYLMMSVLERQRLNAKPNVLRYMSYGSAAALEVAFIIQLLLKDVAQLQFYVLPVGVACLVFGYIEQRHEDRAVAHLLQGLGLVLLLGTSLLQAFGFQSGEIDTNWYGIWLMLESLGALFYGAAFHLRYYFFGGIVALLLDLIPLLTDPAQAVDKWVLLGITGLMLITLALFLERKRELVIRLSKEWIHQLKQWQ